MQKKRIDNKNESLKNLGYWIQTKEFRMLDKD